MIIVDTSVMVTLLNERDDRHEELIAWYGSVTDSLVTTPLAIAEMDHVVAERAGGRASAALYANLESEALAVEWWPEAVARTLAVVGDRPDIGLTDASLVALAAHRFTNEIATLDERHFRTLKPLTGAEHFKLLPADAD